MDWNKLLNKPLDAAYQKSELEENFRYSKAPLGVNSLKWLFNKMLLKVDFTSVRKSNKED